MQNPLMQTIEALAKEKGIEANTIITAICHPEAIRLPTTKAATISGHEKRGGRKVATPIHSSG